MRLLIIAFLLLFGTAQAAELPITVDAATPAQVEALDQRIQSLTATVDALSTVRVDLDAVRTDLAALTTAVQALSNDLAALTTTVGQNTQSVTATAAAIADIEAQLTLIEGRLTDLEASLPTPPVSTVKSANWTAIEDYVAPFLPMLEDDGPDIVTCGPEWPCVFDRTLPEYALLIGTAHHYTGFASANAACNARRGVCKGLAVLPGIHNARQLTAHVNSSGNTVNWNFLRSGTYLPDGKPAPYMIIRAQDRSKFTLYDCRTNWGGGGDFCFYNSADFFLKIDGVSCWGNVQSQNNACYGATSRLRSGLILTNLGVKGIDNCVRTTGMPLMTRNVTLDGCARTGVAHGFYASNDWQRPPGVGTNCTLMIMIDSRSINNELAHSGKSRCAVNYFRGNYLESPNGFCADIPQGGATLMIDNICVKNSGSAYVAIGYGTDKANLSDGSPRADKNATEASLCAWMHRATYVNPAWKNADGTIKTDIPYPDPRTLEMGRITIVDLHVVNNRKNRAGEQMGVAIWANPWKGEDVVCRPPHEYRNVTSEGGHVGFSGDWKQI